MPGIYYYLSWLPEVTASEIDEMWKDFQIQKIFKPIFCTYKFKQFCGQAPLNALPASIMLLLYKLRAFRGLATDALV